MYVLTLALAVDAALTILLYWLSPAFRDWMDSMMRDIRDKW